MRARAKWDWLCRLPINMHIGNMGLAPALGAATSTAPPYRTGGNLDNKRIGIGGMLPLPYPAPNTAGTMLQSKLPQASLG